LPLRAVSVGLLRPAWAPGAAALLGLDRLLRHARLELVELRLERLGVLGCDLVHLERSALVGTELLSLGL